MKSERNLELIGQPAQPTRLLTAAEAGELLGVDQTTIRRMWNARELKCVRVGKGRKVSDAEISRFIAEHEQFDPAP